MTISGNASGDTSGDTSGYAFNNILGATADVRDADGDVTIPMSDSLITEGIAEDKLAQIANKMPTNKITQMPS